MLEAARAPIRWSRSCRRAAPSGSLRSAPVSWAPRSPVVRRSGSRGTATGYGSMWRRLGPAHGACGHAVGADGAHGAVRGLLGMNFRQRATGTHIMLADVPLARPPEEVLLGRNNRSEE